MTRKLEAISSKVAIMPLEVVLDFYKQMDQAGISVWLDGGWGVDALLGKQTRAHGDLDIAIEEKNLPKLYEQLGTEGYDYVPGRERKDWNFVLGNSKAHEIDVHVINIDENGDGIYGPPENNEKYPASALTGKGQLGSVAVRCISPEDMVKFHSGYELDEDDYHDVSALCEKFNIPLPAEYDRFTKQDSF